MQQTLVTLFIFVHVFQTVNKANSHDVITLYVSQLPVLFNSDTIDSKNVAASQNVIRP